ncbi:PREDICTED: 30S ribosomal protein 3-2, chloroplastic [Tarenaya hassleriana]|uniref:Uncharacterized protein n=1 Tax=Tarenaya spinosa TaxID=228870 RepID=Q1KUY8_9ROSI|nr:PREDICTED: 30S ribosomal protein 3-2, chloroplastic [Tarenaya hassleriana]ABD96848.1 hypothetical protein [Tarenaya spinosa]
MAVQLNHYSSSGIKIASPSHTFSSKPSARVPVSTNSRSLPSLSCSFPNPGKNSAILSGFNVGVYASSSPADPIVSDELSGSDSPSPKKKKLRAVVKPLEKPRLVLKFLWMQKDIGIGLDQMVDGYGTIPLSPYYFWPRKDAWEELKVLLESKPWISNAHRVFLLNQATEIINLWQSGGGGLP